MISSQKMMILFSLNLLSLGGYLASIYGILNVLPIVFIVLQVGFFLFSVLDLTQFHDVYIEIQSGHPTFNPFWSITLFTSVLMGAILGLFAGSIGHRALWNSNAITDQAAKLIVATDMFTGMMVGLLYLMPLFMTGYTSVTESLKRLKEETVE